MWSLCFFSESVLCVFMINMELNLLYLSIRVSYNNAFVVFGFLWYFILFLCLFFIFINSNNKSKFQWSTNHLEYRSLHGHHLSANSEFSTNLLLISSLWNLLYTYGGGERINNILIIPMCNTCYLPRMCDKK